MTEANITIEDLGGIKIAHITGQLDESNIDEKIKEIYKVVEQNPKGLKLVFDLENLQYMNSKSIGYLTDLYGKITETGGKVAISKAKSNILDILQVVGLTQLIQNFETLDQAKASLSGETAVAAPATPIAQPPAQATQQTPSAQTQPTIPQVPTPAPTMPAPVAPTNQQPPTQAI